MGLLFLNKINYIILFFVIITIFSFSLERTLDWEEYRLFHTYRNTTFFNLMISKYGFFDPFVNSLIKVSINLFGSSVEGYRVFSQLIGIGGVVFMAISSSSYFQEETRNLFVACLLIVVGFSENFQFFSRWVISSYISGLVIVSSVFPYFFYLIIKEELKCKKFFFFIFFSFFAPVIFDVRSSLFVVVSAFCHSMCLLFFYDKSLFPIKFMLND